MVEALVASKGLADALREPAVAFEAAEEAAHDIRTA
jgi:hypothetical protein